jgi:L-malate glycosyltransferase
MKIAISCHPTQGGSGIVAVELAKMLASRGHHIHVISCSKPFRLEESARLRWHQVTIPEYPLFQFPPHDLCLINKLREVILTHDIEIVHAHYAIPHAICAVFAGQIVKPHPVKIITTLHGTDITLVGSHPGFFELCRYSMLRCDALTAVSNWLADKTMSTFSLDTQPAVIYNFIDPEVFNTVDRVPYPVNSEFVLMHASNFRPVKRVVDIIRVFNRVQKKLPARLVLLGKGPELELARELSAELGISQQVEFAGSQRQIDEYYKRSHFFLLLSNYESFGLSALEAMACGVPVAVTRSGGLPEVLKDGEGGLLCEENSIEDTSDKIITLLQNRDRWEQASKEAEDRALSAFSAAHIIPQYENLYLDQLSK